VTLELSGIRLALPGQEERDILRGPRRLTVDPGAPLAAGLPLRLRPRLPVGEYHGEIRFVFAGETSLLRCRRPTFQVKSLLAERWRTGSASG
jgi:hypothetical protein